MTDVAKWLPKPEVKKLTVPSILPDTTPGTSSDTNKTDAGLGPNHYNLRKHEKKLTVPSILPNATPGTSSDTNKTDAGLGPNYFNLRKHERKVQPNPVSNRPQPRTYAEPTDKSSQDSQIIGTVYTLDSRPALDSTVE